VAEEDEGIWMGRGMCCEEEDEWLIMSKRGTRVWLLSSLGSGRPSGIETVRVLTKGTEREVSPIHRWKDSLWSASYRLGGEDEAKGNSPLTVEPRPEEHINRQRGVLNRILRFLSDQHAARSKQDEAAVGVTGGDETKPQHYQGHAR
jgi:hypothetical protein